MASDHLKRVLCAIGIAAVMILPCSQAFGQSDVEDNLTSVLAEEREGVVVTGDYTKSELRFKQNTRENGEISLAYILSVGLLVVLLVAVVYWRRRIVGSVGASSSRIVVLERRRLSIQSHATILRIDEKEYLLAENNSAISLVPLPSNNN